MKIKTIKALQSYIYLGNGVVVSKKYLPDRFGIPLSIYSNGSRDEAGQPTHCMYMYMLLHPCACAALRPSACKLDIASPGVCNNEFNLFPVEAMLW